MKEVSNAPTARTGFFLNAGAFAMGNMALTVQVVWMRQVLDVFSGNELVLGLSLGMWLAGTSLGALVLPAWLRRWRKLHWIPLILFPVILGNFLLIKWIPRLFHLVLGALPSLSTLLLILMAVFLPAALLEGSCFPFLVEVLPETTTQSPGESARRINRVYLWESVGSFFAGASLHFLFFTFWGSVPAVGLALLLFYLFLFPLHVVRQRQHPAAWQPIVLSLYALFGFALLFWGGQISRGLESRLVRPYQLLESRDTPYGNLKILRQGEQTVVKYQGTVYYSSPDPFTAEGHILLPLLTHPAPRKILVLGGNLVDYLPYLQAFPSLQDVVFVDLDPVLVNLQRQAVEGRFPERRFRLTFRVNDARRFLAADTTRYDLICFFQPEPATLNLNRFYTREFYTLVKKRLRSGGLFAFPLRSSENFVNQALARYLNLVEGTLHQVFAHTFLTPGSTCLVLASQQDYFRDLPASWIARLDSLGIRPIYLNPVYLEFAYSAERQTSFRAQLQRAETGGINRDFNLQGYLYHFLAWGGLTSRQLPGLFHRLWQGRLLFALLFLLVFGLFRYWSRRRPAAQMLATLFLMGFLSLSLEIVFLMEYQVLFGSVYSGIALVFGVFMLGLALGAYRVERSPREEQSTGAVRRLLAGFAALTVLLLILPLTGLEATWRSGQLLLVQWLVAPLVIFLIGATTGTLFARLTRRYFQHTRSVHSGLTYGIDLAGALLGAFFTSLFFIPILGLSLSLMVFLILIIIFWF